MHVTVLYSYLLRIELCCLEPTALLVFGLQGLGCQQSGGIHFEVSKIRMLLYISRQWINLSTLTIF